MSIQTEVYIPDLVVKDGIVSLQAIATSPNLEDSEKSNAESYTTNNIEYTLSSDGSYYIVTGIAEGLKSVSIPSGWVGIPVKAIAKEAFMGNSNITDVIIPASVRTIGADAFWGCTKLKNVTIGDGERRVYFRNTLNWEYPSVCEVGYNEYGSMTYVGTDSDGVEIYGYTFQSKADEWYFCDYDSGAKCGAKQKHNSTNFACYECSTETTANTYLVRECEYNCEKVDADIEKRVLSIGERTFYTTSVQSFNVPNTLREVPMGMFNGCSSLTTLTFSGFSAVRKIGASAFGGCGISGDELSLPYSLVEIDTSAFEGCHSLKAVSVGDNFKTIGNYAFKECNLLVQFRLGSENSVFEKIGSYAFKDCLSLVSVGSVAGGSARLPDSLWFIGMGAFAGCSNLGEHRLVDGYGWFSTSGAVSEDRTSNGESYPLSYQIVGSHTQLPITLVTTHVTYNLYKIDKMPAPTISITDQTLRIVDSTGIANAFKIYVDNEHWATVNVNGDISSEKHA